MIDRKVTFRIEARDQPHYRLRPFNQPLPRAISLGGERVKWDGGVSMIHGSAPRVSAAGAGDGIPTPCAFSRFLCLVAPFRRAGLYGSGGGFAGAKAVPAARTIG